MPTSRRLHQEVKTKLDRHCLLKSSVGGNHGMIYFSHMMLTGTTILYYQQSSSSPSTIAVEIHYEGDEHSNQATTAQASPSPLSFVRFLTLCLPFFPSTSKEPKETHNPVEQCEDARGVLHVLRLRLPSRSYSHRSVASKMDMAAQLFLEVLLDCMTI